MDTVLRFTLLILLCGYIRTRHINDPCNQKACQNGVCKVDDENKVICECYSFFSGEFCGIRLCNAFCEEDEICVLENDVSVCKKKKDTTGGDVCDPNPCENGGSCLADDDNGFACLCDGDYSGKTCNERLCNAFCEEDEICVLENDVSICKKKKDPTGGGICNPLCEADEICVLENDVSICKRKKDITGGDVCDPNPCENRGFCLTDDDNGFTCLCDGDYSGKTCNERFCNPLCEEDEICVFENDNDICKKKEKPTGGGICNSNPCLNNGTCEMTDLGDYFCICIPPYRGDTCEEDPCNPNPCHNGTCFFDGKETSCICDEFSFGQFCEKGPCDSNPCKNGGECTNLDREIFSCKCPPNYSGQTCEQRSILIEIKAEIKISENSFGDFFHRLFSSRSK